MSIFGLSLPKRNRISDAIGATGRGIGRGFDQVNPLDRGKSWQTRQPTYNASFSNQVRDVFDSNSARDMQRRGGQTYRQQQIGLGNKRPYENLGAQVVGNTARFANTASYAGQAAVETGRGLSAQLGGNSPALNASLERQKRQRDTMGKSDSGLLGTGTIFDNPTEMTNLGSAEIAKRVGLNTLGTASEVLPFAKVTRPITVAGKGAEILFKGGRPVESAFIKGASAIERGASGILPKVAFNAGMDSTTGAAESVARQYAQTGRVDPKALAGDVVSNVALGQTQVGASALKGKVKSAKPLGSGQVQIKSDPKYIDIETRLGRAQENMAAAKGKLKANYKQETQELIRLRNERVKELRQVVPEVSADYSPVSPPEKPKITPRVIEPQQPVPDSTYRPRTADEALREIASLSGQDIGDTNAPSLGLINKGIKAVTGGKTTTTRGLNVIRTAADASGRAFTKSSEEAITGASGAPLTNKGRAVFAGTGLADETKAISRQRHGMYANISDLMGRMKKQSDEIQARYGDQGQELLDRTLRDEAYTQRVYGEAPRKLEDLPEDLQVLAKDYASQNQIVNDLNRQTGIIDEKTWQAGTEGQHIGRIFDIPKPEKAMIREGIGTMLETNASIKRKDISKMSDELINLIEKDPIRAMDLRKEMALRNKVFTETMDAYAGRKFIQKSGPNDSFIQLNGKKWGKYEGQFMERGVLEDMTSNRVFNNEMMQSYDKFISGYKSSLLGISDRLQKAFKTTMALGTIIGNFFSNPMIFNVGAGTNPLTQMWDMAGAYRKLSKGLSSGDVYKARQLGVIGGDTGRILTGSSNEQLAIGNSKDNLARRGLNAFGRFYGSIDDGAKLGLWTRLQKQGMSAEDAAMEVAKFTQDYGNVGRVVTLIADTPVLGKPFARFSPELVRIIKNNTTRAPHRMIAGLAGLAFIANKMSQDSGETPEERSAREGAVGQTKIPGTGWINKAMGGPDDNISLNLAAGDTSVNIARSMGLNFPIEPGTDPNRALVEQLLPFEIPVTKDALGNDKFDPTKVVTSMSLRPVIEQLFDKNFMGRKVSDPTNQAYDSQGNVMKLTEAPKNEQVSNRLRSLATSTLPMGNEIDSLQAAFRGKPTALGKERTVPQALLRTVGIKTENNDAAARAKRADTAEYFDTTKKAEQDFLNNNKDLEQLYFKVFPKTKDRVTGLKVSDQITPEKWGRVQSDTSGRLYDFMKTQAEQAGIRDGQPVDPVFKLPTKEQQKQVLELRSKPTGEDIEMDNILEATQGWYKSFKKAESDYYDQSSKYFESKNLPDTQNKRAKDYANVKWPEQSALISQYYTTKEKDPESAKSMFKSTNLSAEFDAYKKQKLDYYNAKRKIEGYDPISESTFNNVSFGYEDDERKIFNELKYGKGYGGGRGGYGGGGGSGYGGFNTAKYFNSVSAPSASVKAKATIKPIVKLAGSNKAKTNKPKVSIKKSRV